MSEEKNTIPESLQTQLLNFTGTRERGNAGFMLFFIDKEGKMRGLERTEYSYMHQLFVSAAEQFVNDNKIM